MAKTQRKTKRQKRSKTNRQKRSIRNRLESKKYLQLLNRAYKIITNDISAVCFDKEDYLLMPYLKTGFSRGWKILKDKNIIKEIDCNSLCMTMSILNSTIGDRKTINKLNPTQKLYLFFLSYLIDDDSKPRKFLDIKHAVRKLDADIERLKLLMNKYEEKGDKRNMKKIDKFISKKENDKQALFKTEGLEPDKDIKKLLDVDICNNIDCEYLHEYHMEKNQKFSKTYSRLCLNITELFKGVVWMNMYMIFNRVLNPYSIPITNPTLNLDLDIRDSLNKVNILLVPNSIMYISDIFYENDMLDRARKLNIENGHYWVYDGLDRRRNKLIKRNIRALDDNNYVVALLNIEPGIDWKSPSSLKAEKIYEKLSDFEKGVGELPKLKSLYKDKKLLGGIHKADLKEDIENSITLHWIYMHRDKLNEYIYENVA